MVYELKFIQKDNCRDGSGHLFTLVYKFFCTEAKLHYIIRAEYHLRKCLFGMTSFLGAYPSSNEVLTKSIFFYEIPPIRKTKKDFRSGRGAYFNTVGFGIKTCYFRSFKNSFPNRHALAASLFIFA